MGTSEGASGLSDFLTSLFEVFKEFSLLICVDSG